MLGFVGVTDFMDLYILLKWTTTELYLQDHTILFQCFLIYPEVSNLKVTTVF